MSRVHVVGGGLAGLAAAVEAVAQGWQVSVYEAAGRFGGRCRSFTDTRLGCVIDNGNHLMLSGNACLWRYLHAIDAADRVEVAASAAFEFYDCASGDRDRLDLGKGRVPWAFLRGQGRLAGTRLGDYRGLARLLGPVGQATIAERLGDHDPLSARLWHPLSIAVMNTAPQAASAALMRAVLYRTVLRGPAATRPCLPLESLDDTFIAPALRWLDRQGATVRRPARLRSLSIDEGRVDALSFGDEVVHLAADERVILALPPRATASLLPFLSLPAEGSPIINGHFRWPVGPVPPVPPSLIGVLNGVAEWIFVKRQTISVTVSAADRLADDPADRIADLLWTDVAQVLGFDPEASRPPARIIKERQATFAQTPENAERRPSASIGLANLRLAGDWVATGLPATMEGAVTSGQQAVASLTRYGRATRSGFGRWLTSG